MRLLVEQKNGYTLSGLYHSGIRDDLVSAFKVQHMAWWVDVGTHPRQKYNLREDQSF